MIVLQAHYYYLLLLATSTGKVFHYCRLLDTGHSTSPAFALRTYDCDSSKTAVSQSWDIKIFDTLTPHGMRNASHDEFSMIHVSYDIYAYMQIRFQAHHAIPVTCNLHEASNNSPDTLDSFINCLSFALHYWYNTPSFISDEHGTIIHPKTEQQQQQ